MDYQGPDAADLRDVRSINRAFLEYLRAASGDALRSAMAPTLRPVVAALRPRQIERLAELPFLLLTLREDDASLWNRLASDAPVRDLFTGSRDSSDPLLRIVSAALGFLWQLARRNAYTARLICGASLDWCDRLAAMTLLQVLHRAADQESLAAIRLAGDTAFWRRLLGAGLSSDSAVRHAAGMWAMQRVLAPASEPGARRLRAAACYSSVPTREIRHAMQTGDDETA